MVFRVPQNLTLADVKPLIGNLSRANYYEVQFGGLSSGLRTYLGGRGVSSSFISGDAGLMCYNGSLPGSSLAKVESNNFSGVIENFAHTRVFTPLSLEFYCDSEYRVLKMLEHWQEYVTSGNGSGPSYGSPYYNYRVKYPNDPADGYKSNSTRILKFENDYSRVLEYSFIGLFPLDMSSTPVRYGPNSELTRISCSFAYDRYVAGSIYSFDFLQGNFNNLSGIVRDITSGNAAALLRRFTN